MGCWWIKVAAHYLESKPVQGCIIHGSGMEIDAAACKCDGKAVAQNIPDQTAIVNRIGCFFWPVFAKDIERKNCGNYLDAKLDGGDDVD